MSTRRLQNWELDKYWLRIAKTAAEESFERVWDAKKWRIMVIPSCVAVLSAMVQFYVVGWNETLTNLKIVGSSVAAGLCVFVVLVLLSIVKKPCEMHLNAADEIARLSAENERLRQPAIGTGLSMAEEDPRVWLEPLNVEVLSNGCMAFELLNQGQRINPAQAIVVQPIQCAPSIRFEYVDRLEMNERKRVVPTVEDDIFSHRNILPELEKAWRASWEDGESDPERVDLEFEIKIAYRDFRPRHFETTVTMKYFPLEMHELSHNFATGRHREYTFLKVTNTDFKRLS